MRRLIYEYRCDERLKTKNEESTSLADLGIVYYESIKRVTGCSPRYKKKNVSLQEDGFDYTNEIKDDGCDYTYELSYTHMGAEIVVWNA